MKLPTIPSFPQFTRKIAIDLGTSRVRIWSNQDGFVIDEPCVIALDRSKNKVIAVGKEAQDMSGRVSKNIEVLSPLSQGVVTDTVLVSMMLRMLLRKILQNVYFFRPSIMMSVPSSITEVEKLALTEVLYGLGAREVFFITQLLAAAIGSGVPIADASGSFLLQLGGGVVEGGIISLGSLVAAESTEYAGHSLDESIKRILRQEAGIDVGLQRVEQLKIQLSTAYLQNKNEMLVTGQDIRDAVPKEVLIGSEIIFPAVASLLERYVRLIKKLFEQIPSELTTDVIDKGMLLSGSFAKLRGLDSFFLSSLGVPVSVVDEPDTSVIKGMMQAMENIDLFKESLGYMAAS